MTSIIRILTDIAHYMKVANQLKAAQLILEHDYANATRLQEQTLNYVQDVLESL